jgi:hypothetical protein
MWRLWSRPLEWLGSIRFGSVGRTRLRVGHPGADDARGGWEWKEFLTSERLYDVWGPAPAGPWMPFHCVPLFAALDRIPRTEVGPSPVGMSEAWTRERTAPTLPPYARTGAPPPPFVGPGTWTILDLPGAAAVEAAAWIVDATGAQPVCTFDNWPHEKGVLRAEEVLAELLRFASTLAAARDRISPTSPPLWICDSDRLGTRDGSPGEFDNRYYLDDSILPGPALLRREGIARIVYLSWRLPEVPVLDLEGYFTELLAAGLPVLHADLDDPSLTPRPLATPRDGRPFPRTGFRRSAAGGFGTEVPQPSSGGGG